MSLARKAAILICAAFPLLAAPRLTTIQDTIYRADGTTFNGTAEISWTPFDASDNSKIGLQSLTVRIINGAVRVQLVPNADATPVNTYTVQYSSDGRQQFLETWSVPSSTTPLRIKDVRVVASSGSTGSTGGGVVQPPSQTPVTESNVVGLLTDLSLRPIKGATFTAGRTAVVNDSGAIDSAIGNLADCVRVDGSAGPCSAPLPAFVDYEIPGGAVDGSNATFTLAYTPAPTTSLSLYRNGLMQQAGSDYSIQGDGSMMFVPAAVPQPGDVLLASYRTGTGDSSATIVASPLTVQAPNVQLLYSGSGKSNGTVNYASLGTCVIPAKTLALGDRVEMRFSFSHQGAANAFGLQVRWGQATMVQRTGSAADAVVTGHGDASVGPDGTTLDMQTWGTALSLDSRVAASSDPLNADIPVDFQAAMITAGSDTVRLENYTVLRYPAH
jgi:hypothetical protein